MSATLHTVVVINADSSSEPAWLQLTVSRTCWGRTPSGPLAETGWQGRRAGSSWRCPFPMPCSPLLFLSLLCPFPLPHFLLSLHYAILTIMPSRAMRKKFDDNFNRLDIIHERDRQTDRHTDRHRSTAKTALTHLASCGKNYNLRNKPQHGYLTT